MRVHNLKIWPEFFEPIARHKKTFEFRVNDRAFQVGDILVLQEYDPDTDDYTGREITAFVPYLMDVEELGSVIMSLEIQEMHQ